MATTSASSSTSSSEDDDQTHIANAELSLQRPGNAQPVGGASFEVTLDVGPRVFADDVQDEALAPEEFSRPQRGYRPVDDEGVQVEVIVDVFPRDEDEDGR